MTFVCAANGYDCRRSGWSADAATGNEIGLAYKSDSASGVKNDNRGSDPVPVPVHEMATVKKTCGGHAPGHGPSLAERASGTVMLILTSTASRLRGPVRSVLCIIRNRQNTHHTSASQQ